MDFLLVGYKQPIVIKQIMVVLFIIIMACLFVPNQQAMSPRSATARSAAALGRPGRPIQIRAESLHVQDPIDWRYRFHI